MRRFLLPTLVFLLFSNVAKADLLEYKIERLIKVIGISQCGFIRNGKLHSPTESMAHVRRKYRHFQDEITSIDDFIARSATKSMISGDIYHVQCGDDIPIPAASWMHDQATKQYE